MKHLLSAVLILLTILAVVMGSALVKNTYALKQFVEPAQSSPLVFTETQTLDESTPISNEEKAALVAGLTMGMDIALALDNRPRLGSAKFYSLMQGFASMVEPCKTVRCVTDRIVKLGNDIRAAQPPDTKRGMPEILR